MFLSAYSLHGCILLVELVELQQQKSSSSLRSSSTYHSIQIKSLNHSQLFLFLMMFVLLCPVYQLNPKLYKIYVVQNVSMLSQSLDDLGITLGECLGRTWWSSPLDLATYLYYFTSGCVLISTRSHDLPEHSMITWSCLMIWLHNLCAIYILTPLCNLMLEIRCLNAWKTLSSLGLS